MSYKRQGKKIHDESEAWREWRSANADMLVKTGLPEPVLRDRDHWWDFLQHGFLDHHDDPQRFSIEELSTEQRQCLRNILHQTLSAEEKSLAVVLRQLDDDIT